jgi:hypothetical protein
MPLPALLNIGIGFSRYFTAVPARTDELKCTAYRIRHDVYCRDPSWMARERIAEVSRLTVATAYPPTQRRSEAPRSLYSGGLVPGHDRASASLGSVSMNNVSMLSVEGVVRGLNFVVRPLYDVIAREVDAAYADSLSTSR